ncbi:AAA family ATPase, partial [Psychromonas sp.]|uniref:AAA family ATPase n=1 Tax=Psychromonas sp. TaxID=1884585 RepID=UPI003A9809D6
MYINSIKVKNFRLIKDATLTLKADDTSDEKLSLLIGRNNTGKTSLIVLLERFLGSKNPSFHFDDFSLSLRNELLNINQSTDVEKIAISLLLDIKYEEKDNLANISDFILDLDDKQRSVKIYFEAKVLIRPLM